MPPDGYFFDVKMVHCVIMPFPVDTHLPFYLIDHAQV